MNRIRLALAAAVASAALIAPSAASAATPPSVAAAIGSAAQGVGGGAQSPEATARFEQMIKQLGQQSQAQLDLQRRLQDQMRQVLEMLQQSQLDRANSIAR